MRLVLASRNEHKLRELAQLIPYELEPLPDAAGILRRSARRDPLWAVEEIALADSAGTRVFNVMASPQFSPRSVSSQIVSLDQLPAAISAVRPAVLTPPAMARSRSARAASTSAH